VGISIVCVIFVLKFLQRFQEKLFETTSNHGDGVRPPHKERTGKQYLYVFGNLMSQGNIAETIGQQVGPKKNIIQMYAIKI
jgi:hypothetical protein